MMNNGTLSSATGMQCMQTNIETIRNICRRLTAIEEALSNIRELISSLENVSVNVQAHLRSAVDSLKEDKSELESQLVDEAAKQILVCLPSRHNEVSIVVAIDLFSNDNFWSLFNKIELRLIEMGKPDPICFFSHYTDRDSIPTTYFTLRFGECLSPDTEPLSPDELKKEAKGYEDWAKAEARWILRQRSKTMRQFFRKIPAPLHRITIFYALIKAIRESDDGLRIDCWRVHPSDKNIYICLA